jgi:pimeloyl-ACP methyl ester carboxylesterase
VSIGPTEAITVPGPWDHRYVSANGARFHVVEYGDGPAVLLLHGFPTFWWTWRHQLESLAAAGYRAVAMDLRGYGGSDHTPHGYDPETLSADVAGVIRSLGEPQATVIGHGWGAFIAWCMPVYQREVTRAIAAIGMPHPRALRAAILGDRRQRRLVRYALGFQVPVLPERRLMRDDAALVETLLRRWSGSPHWPDAEAAARYRAAFAQWPTAHTAIEYHRWAVRSAIRSDGRRFADRMREAIDVPVLTIRGTADTAILPESFDGSADYVSATYAAGVVDDAGHFPHEEAPAVTSAILTEWLRTLP